ncbi:MAG: Ig-like domain-containing protein [Ignavibacteria bacterium]|nr:Ig-like domain-containing protein [Ignavibacteria bacterium]
MNKFKQNVKKWLIPLILGLVLTSCDERIGLITPPLVTSPTVSSTSPANADTGVALNTKIAVTFSEEMDSLSITTATFTLMQGNTFTSGTVRYNGLTATFTPESNLEPYTTYIGTITTGAKSRAGKAIQNNYVWSFFTGASATVTPPIVSFTDPANSETGVALNQKIAATFSKAMDASTITTASFTVMQGSVFISGTVSYVGTTATFIPSSNLVSSTTYTATITTGAKDLTGNSMVKNYVWIFTTGVAAVVTPPTVSSTDPLNGATAIPFNQKVSATFSKTMDASTVTTATFTLAEGSAFVAGTVTYVGRTATFSPTINLKANTLYVATITTGAKDLTGNNLVENYVWKFTTGAGAVITPPVISSIDPVNAATGVPLNQKIAATFSKTMDATTITGATFILKQGFASVPGFVSYFGTTATFAPATNLLPNTTYTVTITTGARDLAGIALENNYTWNFTTGLAVVIVPPSVSSTDPSNNATGIALNQKISATFSKAMDPSTLTTATFTLSEGSSFVSGTIQYVGMTATFIPSVNLLSATTYTATITTGAKDLTNNSIVENYVWRFTTGAGAVVTPPIVTSTVPVNQATGVPLNQKIAATFSKSMDASTITGATFTLKQGNNSVSGFVSYFGTTATFTPATNLAANTVYTATITTGVKDLTGNALVNNYVWTFTTGTGAVITPPVVSSTDPLNNATGVPLNQKIAATFSKTMDASTITTATFTLKHGTTVVSGFVSYLGTTASFSPTNNLLANTLYTATITTGAKDLTGNALVNDYVWTFTTGGGAIITPPIVISTSPSNLATGVPLNQKVSATFSKSMDPSTITNSTFTLKDGSNPVSGFVSYFGTTATFTPSSNLQPNTQYTGTITTGAKDLTGNALENNYVWTFTTGAAVVITPPTVILTDPLNNATGVPVTKKITATFSKAMDPSTITTATFTLMQGATFVAGTVSYSGMVATYTPSSNLALGTVYTATINTGAKDLAGNALAANYVWKFTTGFATGQLPVNLGSAARFAILSNSAITNVPTSAITGDVGIYPGARGAITGLTLPEVTGTIFAADDPEPVPSMLIAAKLAAQVAYLDAISAARGTPTPLSGNINGLTLVPGLYQSGTSIELSAGGIVYFDAQGDPNAVFIIRSSTSITTLSTSQVVLTGGAQAKNIFWSAGSAITLGTNSKMFGTLIASTSISLLTGSRLDGRALIQGAAAGQISLDQSTIVVPPSKRQK